MSMQAGRPTRLWKNITGYEGLYQVSCDGLVRSLDRYIKDKRARKRFVRGRLLKPERCKSTGYLYVNLHKDGVVRHCTVHRLVAQAFIPNPNNLPCVNHKDEIRHNNCVDNLEWITNMDNLRYSDSWRRGAQNRRDYTGAGNPFYGKHHTEEARRKISVNNGNRRIKHAK